MSVKTVSVYCGSSYPVGENAEHYIAAIKSLGRMLGERGVLVCYGGGLYGHLKDLMEEVGNAGGRMQAILSDAYFKPEEVYPSHVEVVRRTTDIERAEKFLDSDAYIVTPGGDGTFCEGTFTQNRNLTRLFTQQAQRPLIYLNVNGFYDNIRKHFESIIREGYSNNARQSALHFASDVDSIEKVLWPDLAA